jgi:hypothetical protein
MILSVWREFMPSWRSSPPPGLWAFANLMALNLPSYPDSFGWYFNPFAWQLLFSLGVLAGLAHRRGVPVSRSPWLLASAMAYLLFGCLLAAPWTRIPGLEELLLLPRDVIGPISKESLSLWRLANILAFVYVGAVLIPASASWLSHPCCGWVINLGRNALAVFCVGTILWLVGFVVLVEVHHGIVAQAAVNLGGLVSMGMMAWWAGERRRRQRAAPSPDSGGDRSCASRAPALHGRRCAEKATVPGRLSCLR